MNKLHIYELPITNEFRRQKRLIQERGELSLIEDGDTFRHLGYFSLLANKGYRGGHYHQQKNEKFYVISGSLQIDLIDVESLEKEQVKAEAGTKITIYPGLAHLFQAIEDAQVIEYYNAVFDNSDDIPFNFSL